MEIIVGIFVSVLLFFVFVFVLGYECGHSDGMRCSCEPNQPRWRKWLNVHRARPPTA